MRIQRQEFCVNPLKINQHILRFVRTILLLIILIDIGGIPTPADVLGGTGAGTGPGGVGSSDGTSSLVLWLDADAISTNPVSSWPDGSGYVNDAEQLSAESQPALVTNQLNGQAVVRFDGSDDFMLISDDDSLDNTSGLTILMVVRPSELNGSTQGLVSKRLAYADSVAYSLYFWTANNLYIDIDESNIDTVSIDHFMTNSTYTNDTPRIIELVFDGTRSSAERSTIFNEGTWDLTEDDTSASIQNYGSDLYIGDLNQNGSPYAPFDGDIAEVIIYREALGSAGRILVENHLGAKYDLPVSAGTDHYEGDTSTNGEFDLNVAGIGLEADGSNAMASSAGMRVQDNTYLSDHGDYLLFGHRSLTNTYITADIPWDSGTDPYARRWSRDWYFDVTDDPNTIGGSVDISFDYPDAGLAVPPLGDAANYKLLKRTSASGTFSQLGYPAILTGDRVVFSGVSVTDLDGYITLGTSDYGLSLSVKTEGQGRVDQAPDPETYEYGEVVTLTATSDLEWTFAGWDGDLMGSSNPAALAITDHSVVTATFTQNQYTLAIHLIGQGQVDVDPDLPAYHYDDLVTLSAVEDPGWTFAGWSGDLTGLNNPDQITIQSNTTVSATFTMDPCYTLTIGHLGSGSEPAADPAHTDGCHPGQHVAGESISLSGVVPDPGWQISGWRGTSQDNSTKSTNTVIMPAFDHQVKVVYKFYIYLPWIIANDH